MKCLVEVEIPPGQTPPTQSSTEQTLLRSQSFYFFLLILSFVHRLVGNTRHFFFSSAAATADVGHQYFPVIADHGAPTGKVLKQKNFPRVAISTTNSFPFPPFLVEAPIGLEVVSLFPISIHTTLKSGRVFFVFCLLFFVGCQTAL